MIDISHAELIDASPTHALFTFSGKEVSIPNKYLKRVLDSYYVDTNWVDRMLLNYVILSAFDQGAQAWRDGLRRNANSFIPKSQHSRDWFDGFDSHQLIGGMPT